MSCILGACIVAAQLTQGGVYSTPLNTVSYKYFDEGTGELVHAENKEFFKATNTQFRVGGNLILDTDTRVDLLFDTGFKSMKKDIDKSVNIGLTQLFIIGKDSHITAGVSRTFGGDVTLRPGIDKHGKEFNLFDVNGITPFLEAVNKDDTKVSLNYTLKFNSFLGTKIK